VNKPERFTVRIGDVLTEEQRISIAREVDQLEQILSGRPWTAAETGDTSWPAKR
jgi:hypothetical protein